MHLDILNSDVSKTFASSTQNSALGYSAKSTQIQSQKCPLVKITTNKSDQKSNDCDDLYDNYGNKFNAKDNKNNVNYSFDNFIDEYDADDYFSYNSSKKDINNNINNKNNEKVFAENQGQDLVNQNVFISDSNLNGEFGNVSNNYAANPEIGDFYLGDKFGVMNSEISFDQTGKFQFQYESQNKMKNDLNDIKNGEGKDNDIDGMNQPLILTSLLYFY